ncbi:MAG: UDP-N-acetylglucosamine 2-epimerase, partial [bacterium]|nr:UDP-N-acetylglucosamine 2-epimerase [bacterium]
MKILTVIGARPQFIKASALSRIIKKWNQEHPNQTVHEILLHTGQHYDENMSQVFFEELEIPEPKYNLNVGSDFHGAQTGRMLEGIETVLMKEHPDWVLTYGDTNSTLAGSLAAKKLHIPVAHVEAGLRSFNMRIPEEINRIITDRISDLLFCPTQAAMENLKKEGILQELHHVGDVMYDCALYYGRKPKEKSRILELLNLKRGFRHPFGKNLDFLSAD